MGLFSGLFRRRPRAAATVQHKAARLVEVGGRQYLADAPYVLPKDDAEINRLDFQHYMLRYAMKGNYAAPLTNPLGILDVGCGTGRWAMEMAQLFPAANVIGVDIQRPHLETAKVEALPLNYAFVQANVLEGLPFADADFGFVHMRLVGNAIPLNRWPATLGELVRITRQGGWIELVEMAPPRNAGQGAAAIQMWTMQLMASRNMDAFPGARLVEALRQAGLANVDYREVTLLVGNYGGRSGRMAAADGIAASEALAPLIVGQGIATAGQYDQALATMQREFVAPTGTCVWPFSVAFGQRVA
jgi:ubiquinone/menaquinone biosynthesis C-methylase UbiE